MTYCNYCICFFGGTLYYDSGLSCINNVSHCDIGQWLPPTIDGWKMHFPFEMVPFFRGNVTLFIFGRLSFLLDLNIKNQPQLLSWIPIMNDFILETLHCHNVERIVTHHSLPMWWFHSKFEKKSTRHTYNQFFQLRFLSPSFSYTFKPSAMTRLRKPVFFPWFFMEARGNCKPA